MEPIEAGPEDDLPAKEMPTLAEHAAFEKWVQEQRPGDWVSSPGGSEHHRGRYFDRHLNSMWISWSAGIKTAESMVEFWKMAFNQRQQDLDLLNEKVAEFERTAALSKSDLPGCQPGVAILRAIKTIEEAVERDSEAEMRFLKETANDPPFIEERIHILAERSNLVIYVIGQLTAAMKAEVHRQRFNQKAEGPG